MTPSKNTDLLPREKNTMNLSECFIHGLHKFCTIPTPAPYATYYFCPLGGLDFEWGRQKDQRPLHSIQNQLILTMSTVEPQLLAPPLFKIPTLSGLDNVLALGFSEPQSTLFTNVQFFKKYSGEKHEQAFQLSPALYWPNSRDFSIFCRCISAVYTHGQCVSQKQSTQFFLGCIFQRKSSEDDKNHKRMAGICKKEHWGCSFPDKLPSTEVSDKTPRTRFAKPLFSRGEESPAHFTQTSQNHLWRKRLSDGSEASCQRKLLAARKQHWTPGKHILMLRPWLALLLFI